MALALALHVTDEVVNDFLSVYNPTVGAIRERIGFFPMPTFTFEVWITGLIVAVLLLLSLSPLAFRANKGLRWVGYALAVLMFFNWHGAHCGFPLHEGLDPRRIFVPILLAASVWLWRSLGCAAPRTDAELHRVTAVPQSQAKLKI